MGIGGKYINFLESTGVGMQFTSISVSPQSEDKYNLVVVMVMSLISSAIYVILVWYIDNVAPGKCVVKNTYDLFVISVGVLIGVLYMSAI